MVTLKKNPWGLRDVNTKQTEIAEALENLSNTVNKLAQIYIN